MNITINGQTISTDRLYMRKLSLEDIDDIYEIVKKDEVGKWLASSKGMTKEETKIYVEKFVNHWNQYGFGVWAILDNVTKKIIGHCGLRYIDEKEEDIEIMYLLDPECWGKGYATEAANASIHYATNSMKIKKLIARIKVANAKSSKVLETLGFEFTGNKDYPGKQLSHYEMKLGL
ncbi:GNAT family N-acetyltransferase [Bacillus sp. S13(2024)]|uniref:GNAT family N-acetyltransferase n=1 Tax=unclassified Bacillus (in: firmicutes) TaxID=185979 RepID=UPI003D1CBDC3